MTEISNSSHDDYDDNLALSYNYIEKSLQEVQDINNNTNTQLGLLIGFNFTFIRFFINDLATNLTNNSAPCNSCLLLKVLAYFFSSASIICCFFGLYKTVKYYIIPPHLLIENCDKVPSSELKLAIMDTWQEKLKNFKEVTQEKKRILNKAIALISISGLMSIFNYIVVSIFS